MRNYREMITQKDPQDDEHQRGRLLSHRSSIFSFLLPGEHLKPGGHWATEGE